MSTNKVPRRGGSGVGKLRSKEIEQRLRRKNDEESANNVAIYEEEVAREADDKRGGECKRCCGQV